ncbi:MAG TPA: nuclear transport factor 2 family protein [Pyrinomonadaceae bacterium]|nr:nuclear transport factor 2 family protein [Pyrinomonadaceae bacterium]
MQRYAARLSAALVAFLVGTASSSLFNVFSPARVGSAEREVLEVEREYVRAHLERDVAALERLLSDDFSSFRGRVRKEHRLAMLANPYFKIDSLKTEGVEVSVSGDEARVSGRASMKGSLAGRDFETPDYKFTRRLAKRNGRWQITRMRFRLTW